MRQATPSPYEPQPLTPLPLVIELDPEEGALQWNLCVKLHLAEMRPLSQPIGDPS